MSTWNFDITKTVFDNVSKAPYTNAAGATLATPTFFSFMCLVNNDSALIASSQAASYIYKYSFESGHDGEINYLKDGYDARSAQTSNMRSVCVDVTGKRWFCEGFFSQHEIIRGTTIDAAYDVGSIPAFSGSWLDELPYYAQNGYGLAVSTDGTKVILLMGDTPRSLAQYTLSTPFLLSSASIATTTVSMTGFSATATHWYSFAFSPDGYRMVFVGLDKVHVFDLSVPWSIATMSLTGVYTAPYTNLSGVCVNQAATKMYVSSSTSGAYLIYQFSLNE